MLNALNKDNTNIIKQIKFDSCFEFVKGSSITKEKCKDGIYNLIGSSKNNNGIIKSSDTYTYNEGLYTLAKNGSIGYNKKYE